MKTPMKNVLAILLASVSFLMGFAEAQADILECRQKNGKGFIIDSLKKTVSQSEPQVGGGFNNIPLSMDRFGFHRCVNCYDISAHLILDIMGETVTMAHELSTHSVGPTRVTLTSIVQVNGQAMPPLQMKCNVTP